MDLKQESSENLLDEVIVKVLDNNPDETNRLHNGEIKLVSFFMGQVMKESKGKYSPQLIIQELNKIINDR